MERIDTDVAVVGAGYAGLTTASTLAQAGARTVVLEARDRVGGRVWTKLIDGGAPLDMGGTWLAPDHTAARDLAQELGAGLYPTFNDGAIVFTNANGKRSTYSGLSPKISPFALLSLGQGMFRLDRMARSLPVEEPWLAKRAAAWDARSTADWIDANVPTRDAKHLLRATVRGLLTADPSEISLLHLLYLTRSAGGLSTLLSVEGGYQQDRISGGAQTMANIMAADLGDAIRCNSPVTAIDQDGDGVIVRSASGDVRARYAVVTTPPALAARIAFDPPLPQAKAHLLAHMPAGGLIKAMVVYGEPFWRAAGLNGQSVAMDSPIETTLDASPKEGVGVIAAFAFGPYARDLAGMTPGERRRIVLDALTIRFGPRAADPIAYEEADWEAEEWTRGCSAAHMGTGVLSAYGPALRPPTDRIHWAGSETATTSHLAIDGAIRSGQRAATEVLALLP